MSRLRLQSMKLWRNSCLLSLALFCLILFGVLNGRIFSEFDQNIVGIFPAFHSSAFISFMFAVTRLADPLLTLGVSLILVASLAYRKLGFKELVSILAISLGSLFQYLVKDLTQIDRPAGSLVETLYASFPSGHATTITIFALISSWVFGDSFKTKKGRYIFYGIMAVMVVLVGVSRVYLLAHWPSDVIAGICLGIFSFTFAFHICKKFC